MGKHRWDQHPLYTPPQQSTWASEIAFTSGSLATSLHLARGGETFIPLCLEQQGPDYSSATQSYSWKARHRTCKVLVCEVRW